MTITTTKGHRHPEDIIIHYNGKPISIYETAQILLLLWKNEDTIHKPPEQGAKMLLNFITPFSQTLLCEWRGNSQAFFIYTMHSEVWHLK